jgi:hypothetical protein
VKINLINSIFDLNNEQKARWFFIFLFILLVLILFLFVYKYYNDNKLLNSVTNRSRGTWSERDLILKLLKNGFPSNSIFHDLYIKKNDGSYSQVDLVLVTDVGIIVIEVKKYSGWIYGVGNREKWMQVLDYGKVKYPIYNPVFQNDGHIRAIKNQIPSYLHLPFHSLIVFYGNCELKKISNIPNEVIVVKANKAIACINDILQNILSKNFYTEEVVSVLKKGVENGDDLDIQNKHIENIKNKFS